MLQFFTFLLDSHGCCYLLFGCTGVAARYEGGLNSVVGRWYRTRTSFLFKSSPLENECYAPFNDNCNLAFQVRVVSAEVIRADCLSPSSPPHTLPGFLVSQPRFVLCMQTFYRYLWTVNWIYDRNDVCPLPGQDIVDAVAGICTQELLCGSTFVVCVLAAWNETEGRFMQFRCPYSLPAHELTGTRRGRIWPMILWISRRIFSIVLPLKRATLRARHRSQMPVVSTLPLMSSLSQRRICED